MKIAESKREGSGGITFYTRTWEPDAKAKGVVALVHGQVMIHAGAANPRVRVDIFLPTTL